MACSKCNSTPAPSGTCSGCGTVTTPCAQARVNKNRPLLGIVFEWVGRTLGVTSGKLLLKNQDCIGHLTSEVPGPVRYDQHTGEVYVGLDQFPDDYACDENQPSGFPVMAIDPGCRQPGENPDRQFAPVRPQESSSGIPMGFVKQCSVGNGIEQELQPILLVPDDQPECPPAGYRRVKSKYVPKSRDNPCGPSMDWMFENGLTFDKDEVQAIGPVIYNKNLPVENETAKFAMLVPKNCPGGGWALRYLNLRDFSALVAAQQPATNTPGTATPDQYFVFHATYGPQIFTVPAGAKFIYAELWGAGGRSDGSNTSPYPAQGRGGPGGYTSFDSLAATPGDQFLVMVGVNIPDNTTPVYGFGGTNSPDGHNHSGGGLSGIFVGPGAVSSNDAARAIAIAGGGGAGGANNPGSAMAKGGTGNDPGAGGMPTFQGASATNGQFTGKGGGGGGYNGGVSLGLNGQGGTGFIKTSVVASYQLQHAGYDDNLPPGTASANYADSAGQPDKNGLVVIRVTF